jgi:alkylation response protein AidB-like acyl-CoA dehydrogenase
MREFVEKEIKPFSQEWDESREIPKDVIKKAFKAGWLAGSFGKKWPTEYIGDNIAGGKI